MATNRKPYWRQTYHSRNYYVKYRKDKNFICIYRKKGPEVHEQQKYAFCFGGVSCHASEDVLRAFADAALKKLDAGMEEGKVAKWSRQQVA